MRTLWMLASVLSLVCVFSCGDEAQEKGAVNALTPEPLYTCPQTCYCLCSN